MLDPQVIMNLFPQVCVGVDLLKHDHLRVCAHLGATAIALANKMIGQTAIETTMPKATSSDK